jgi:hypothetical protein
MATTTQTIPPFLRLPTEIRFLIYEAIPLVRRHQTISPCSDQKPVPGISDPPKIIIHLITTSMSTSILSTCRFLHNEATVIFSARLHALRMEAPSIIVESFSRFTTSADYVVLNYVLARVAHALHQHAIQDTEYTSRVAPSGYWISDAQDYISRGKIRISATYNQMVEDFVSRAVTQLLMNERQERSATNTLSSARVRILIVPNFSNTELVSQGRNTRWENTDLAMRSFRTALVIGLQVTIQFRGSYLGALDETEQHLLRSQLLGAIRMTDEWGIWPRYLRFSEDIDEEEWVSKWAASGSGNIATNAK